MYGTMEGKEPFHLEEQEISYEVHSTQVNSKKRSTVLVSSIVIATIFAGLLFGTVYQSGMLAPGATMRSKLLSTPSSSDIVTATSDEIYITATNEYGQFTAPYPWMNDVAGTQLIEPYRETTLTLTGTYAESEGYSFVWVIEGLDTTLEGTSPTLTLTDVGKYTVNVHAYNADGDYQATYSTLFICKYVKREIRTLTDTDRDAVLDAMAAVWQYSQEEGEALYGKKFTSIEKYVTVHSAASNDIMCDMYHEGSGFLTHHLGMAVSFEAAIRSVNPAVTLPYWDFTIEGEYIKNLGKPPSYMMEFTPIFSADWFGSVDDDNHIQDGRWAHSLMPVAADEETTQNSYGFIRSYWNNNPDEEIARHLFDACGSEPEHKAIPHCSTHYDILNAKNFGLVQLLSPGDGHGPMHVQTGGVWGGCTDAYYAFIDKWGDFLDTTMTDEEVIASGNDLHTFTNKWGSTGQRRVMVEKAIMGEYFHIYRSMWRSHMCAVDGQGALLECPEECDVETVAFEECTCNVNKLTNGETTWQNLFPCVLNSESNRIYFNSTMPDELLEDLTTFLATSSVLEGEMIESASTADPLFWIIHPVIERLVSAKR